MFRRMIDAKARAIMEPDFSPAMARLQSRPPAVGAQALVGVLSLLTLCLVLWLTFGHVNILVTAFGKIETVQQMTRIQPVAAGKIKQLLVQEGEQVSKGQLLLELDTTEFDVDKRHLERELVYQEIILERLSSTYLAFKGQQKSREASESTALLDADFSEHQQLKMLADINSYHAEIGRFESKIEEKQAELAELAASINKIEELLAISREQEEAKRVLSDKKMVSRLTWLEQRRSLLAEEQELLVLDQRVGRINASINQIQQEMRSYKADRDSELATFRLKALESLTSARDELKRMDARIAHSRLHAPVSGTVHELQAYRAGEVLLEAQPAMTIIPDKTGFEVTTYVPNKDIGFVQLGGDAVIKVESYPYTQYGTLNGQIKNISPDIVELTPGHFFYEVKITLKEQFISHHGKKLKLTPGMAVVAEITTGKRKIIDYFISPLIEMKDSAFSER